MLVCETFQGCWVGGEGNGELNSSGLELKCWWQTRLPLGRAFLITGNLDKSLSQLKEFAGEVSIT